MHIVTTRSPLVRRILAATALCAALAVSASALAGPAAAAPSAARSCKSFTKNISYLQIRTTRKTPAKLAIGCQEANAVGNTWMLRFRDHMPVKRFSIDWIDYRCSLVPTLPRNTRCIGGGTAVTFSAPTGG